MAARTPRRSFATPFVVTLASAPACYTSSAPPPQAPVTQAQEPQPASPPSSSPGSEGPSESHPVIVGNPPRPSRVPAGQHWTIFKQADGTCAAVVPVQCTPKATCNPPPPQPYGCPADISLDTPVTIVSADDGTCHIEVPPPPCRPGISCNPPRPAPVACPR